LIGRSLLLLAAALLGGPADQAPGQGAPLSVAVAEGAPLVVVGPVLQEGALQEALRSGLPLRVRTRVELWRVRLFDELVDHVSWTQVLLFEPIEGRYLLGPPDSDTPRSYSSFTDARAAIERDYRPRLRPRSSGRYYFLATLEIETLSLSDLEELGQWLRGDLRPAVEGRRSVVGAVGTGIRRLFIRILDLPARRYSARSEEFVVP
jgi:hypothetical protein